MSDEIRAPWTERPLPLAGQIYRHFKDRLYEIVACPVSHTETGERFVVYRALYGSFGVYARPLEMFMSPVDRVKYPNVDQTWRFERVLVDLEAD